MGRGGQHCDQMEVQWFVVLSVLSNSINHNSSVMFDAKLWQLSKQQSGIFMPLSYLAHRGCQRLEFFAKFSDNYVRAFTAKLVYWSPGFSALP